MGMISRHITIALITPSQILFSGLSATLSHLDGMNAKIIHAEPSEIENLVSRHRVSVIIIDAITSPWDTIERLHSEDEQSQTAFILLATTQLPSSLTRNYDAVISIYDSERDIRRSVSAAIRSTRDNEASTLLTPREREIVISVAKGMSNKEVASAIGLSVNTVMTHRRNIAAKLHIHSPAGLTIYALATKLVDINDIKTGDL